MSHWLITLNTNQIWFSYISYIYGSYIISVNYSFYMFLPIISALVLGRVAWFPLGRQHECHATKQPFERTCRSCANLVGLCACLCGLMWAGAYTYAAYHVYSRKVGFWSCIVGWIAWSLFIYASRLTAFGDLLWNRKSLVGDYIFQKSNEPFGNLRSNHFQKLLDTTHTHTW